MTAPGVSADTLLKNADMALYRAKADGRGTFCFFRDEMAQTVEARRILELDLRKALANEEFELFYQPQVRLIDGGLVGADAQHVHLAREELLPHPVASESEVHGAQAAEAVSLGSELEARPSAGGDTAETEDGIVGRPAYSSESHRTSS